MLKPIDIKSFACQDALAIKKLSSSSSSACKPGRELGESSAASVSELNNDTETFPKTKMEAIDVHQKSMPFNRTGPVESVEPPF